MFVSDHALPYIEFGTLVVECNLILQSVGIYKMREFPLDQ